MSKPNQDALVRLWDDFLDEVNKVGYVIKSNEELNFQPKFNNRHEVTGRISLRAPSDTVLVDKGYKPSYTLTPDVRKKYEENNEKVH